MKRNFHMAADGIISNDWLACLSNREQLDFDVGTGDKFVGNSIASIASCGFESMSTWSEVKGSDYLVLVDRD